MCHESDIARTAALIKSIGYAFSPDLDLSRG
jgi:hypothetical protein